MNFQPASVCRPQPRFGGLLLSYDEKEAKHQPGDWQPKRAALSVELSGNDRIQAMKRGSGRPLPYMDHALVESISLFDSAVSEDMFANLAADQKIGIDTKIDEIKKVLNDLPATEDNMQRMGKILGKVKIELLPLQQAEVSTLMKQVFHNLFRARLIDMVHQLPIDENFRKQILHALKRGEVIRYEPSKMLGGSNGRPVSQSPAKFYLEAPLDD